MTRGTSCQTSVTPGCAFILSSFLLLLTPTSVLDLHQMVVYRKNCDHTCQETSDRYGGVRGGHRHCRHGLSVNLSLSYHFPHLISTGSTGPTKSAANTHTHTHLTHTLLHFEQYHRVHLKFDRQGHTQAVSAHSQWGKMHHDA